MPPRLLRLGDRLERKRGLAGGFRPVDLDHAAARQAADPKAMSSPREPVEMASIFSTGIGAQAHDGALAEDPFDLAQRGIQRLVLVHRTTLNHPKIGLPHRSLLLFHTGFGVQIAVAFIGVQNVLVLFSLQVFSQCIEIERFS